MNNNLAKFLQNNTGYNFHLQEFLESTLYTSKLDRSFQNFMDNFLTDTFVENPWETYKYKFQQAVSEIIGYNSISFDEERYWNKIPFIDKSDLRTKNDDFLNRNFDKKKLWLRETSGTTGRPVSIWYSSDFFFDFHFYAIYKITWLAGKLTQDLLERPIFCLALFDNKYLTPRVWASYGKFQGLTIRMIFDESQPLKFHANLLDFIKLHKPAVLTLKPNILESLLRYPGSFNYKTMSDICLIISGGSDLDEAFRQKAQIQLGITIINAYGLSEFGIFASECENQNGLHLYDEDIIIEILNEGKLKDSGIGELVVSSIKNLAMPLLRYKTGDIVEVILEPCKCGRRGKRIKNITGRIIHNFKLPNGSEFGPSSFNRIFDSFQINEFRLTQATIDKICVEIELTSECTNPELELDLIKNSINKILGNSINIEIIECVFERSGKFQRYRALI